MPPTDKFYSYKTALNTKKMKLSISLILLILFTLPAFAQESNQRTYRRFATQEVQARLLLQEQPELLDQVLAIEDWVDQYRSTNNGTEKFTIPIVFHLLTSPEKTPVTPDQVADQIAALNRDFGRKKTEATHPADLAANFLVKAAKMDIDFCLPQSRPDGSPTSGINYLSAPVSAWTTANDMKFSDRNGLDAWDTDRYLNVWVVDLENDLAGYAQMPGGPQLTDGIVISTKYFGTGPAKPEGYQEGKTLTHLVGSYLGLHELWDYKGRCRDDRVDDTPVHNSPNVGCPEHNHLSFCSGEMTEMLMNFMDNSDDPCMDMFTIGQRQRVLAMLSPGGPRHNLVADSKTQCKKGKEKDLVVEAPVTLGNMEAAAEPQVRLYPNPVKDKFQIELTIPVPIEAYQCTIQTALGQEMIQLQFGASLSGSISQPLDVSDWPAGLYYFKMSSEQGIISVPFTIQK